MADTLLLDQTTWDLCLDASGNLARAQEPYAIAQDVASAVKTFLGECWYDTRLGIPYLTQILGHKPPLALIRRQVEQAALHVPMVATAVASIALSRSGVITGNVTVTNTLGVTQTVSF